MPDAKSGDAGSKLDAAMPDDTGVPSDAGVSSDVHAPSDSGFGVVGSSEAGYSPDADTSAITGLPANAWQWVPVSGAMCRDGSPTGILVNESPGSTELMIFLQGGGECMNAATCKSTPLNFNPDAGVGGASGSIFDRTLATNPVKDWSFVFVPYCTGDLHGGNNPGAHPSDVATPQQYVGYVDMSLFLARLVPTFPGLTKVLLTGTSAGGAGVELNYLQTQEAFAAANPNIIVDALDDSGPPMPTPYLSDCLQTYWAELFGYERTVLEACGAPCAVTTNAATTAAKVMAQRFPNNTFGVLDSMDDGTISTLYGYGQNDCSELALNTKPPAVPAATFEAGQLATRTELAGQSNFGSFLFPGTTHTTLGGSDFATRTSTNTDAGIRLTTWVASLVNGTVTNAGPDAGP